jgi:hypothetical protein
VLQKCTHQGAVVAIFTALGLWIKNSSMTAKMCVITLLGASSWTLEPHRPRFDAFGSKSLFSCIFAKVGWPISDLLPDEGEVLVFDLYIHGNDMQLLWK